MRGRVLSPRTAGRILGRETGAENGTGMAAPIRAAPLSTERRSLWALLILLAALPLFGQFFHYMTDAGPLYFLSKAWPVITLPLAVWGIITLRGPQAGSYLALFSYAVVVTPVLSMLYLGNGLADAAFTTVKIWPVLYFFSVGALLAVLKPESAVLRRLWLLLAGLTLFSLWLLWLTVPLSRYASDPAQSRLFMLEIERGYRIYMPMTFVLGLIFYATRRWLWDGRWLMLLPLVFSFVSMLAIYKQRVTIAAAALLVLLLILRRLPRGPRFFLMAAAGTTGGLGLLIARFDPISYAENFGASLTVRLNTIEKVSSFLFGDPLRWLFGIGSVTRFSEKSLSDILGGRFLYLADIGWLGVVFEYGLTGAILIAVPMIFAVREAIRVRNHADRFIAALGDLILLLALETLIYSPVFTPGIMGMLAAILFYERRRASPADPGTAAMILQKSAGGAAIGAKRPPVMRQKV